MDHGLPSGTRGASLPHAEVAVEAPAGPWGKCRAQACTSTCAVKRSHRAILATKGFFGKCQNRNASPVPLADAWHATRIQIRRIKHPRLLQHLRARSEHQSVADYLAAQLERNALDKRAAQPPVQHAGVTHDLGELIVGERERRRIQIVNTLTATFPIVGNDVFGY